MNDLELTVIDLLDEAIKHGKHNQASHGRRTARRRAYSAAYSQARSGGASPAEARAKAREAGLARQSERDVRLERLQERAGGKGRVGTKTVAYGDDPNKPYTLTHRLMDMSEVTASNLPNGAVNPKYDAELQPRDRTRAASQMQIDQVARKLNPDVMVLDTHAIDRGTPIIDAKGNVLSGNGRTLALQRAAEMHPERYAAYREKIREDAKRLGIDPREVDKMKNPVLVRQVDPTVDRVTFAREANAPAVLGMSRMEQAAVDAKVLPDRAVSGLVVREGQDIDRALRSPDNKAVVDGLLNRLPPNERARLMTRDGTLNQDGLYRVKAAIYTKTFDSETGSRMAESMLESLDPDLKNVQNGISGALPGLSRAKSLIRSGDRDKDLDITDDFSSAVDRLARVRANPRFSDLPTNKIVSNYLDQMKSQMFDEGRISSSERRMLVWLDRNSRRPTAVRDMLNRYSDIVDRQASPKQTDFGGVFGRLTRSELLDSLFGPDDEDEGPSQGSLF